MNAIMTLFPYKLNGIWVFDDKIKELEREAFVSGMTEIMQKLVDTEIQGDVDEGFVLHFASEPFPGFQAKLTWSRQEFTGNWYDWKSMDMEGWLCPALLAYFDDAPAEIYVQAKPMY